MSGFDISLTVDDIADALSRLTRFEIERLRDRFDVLALLPPNAEVEAAEEEVAAAERRLENTQRKITQAHIKLNAVGVQIEAKTQVLQALVRASQPAAENPSP